MTFVVRARFNAGLPCYVWLAKDTRTRNGSKYYWSTHQCWALQFEKEGLVSRLLSSLKIMADAHDVTTVPFAGDDVQIVYPEKSCAN